SAGDRKLRARGQSGRQGRPPALREPAPESLAAPVPTRPGRRGDSAMTSWKTLRRGTPVLVMLSMSLIGGLAGCSSLLHSNAPAVQVYTLRTAPATSDSSADPPA